MSLAPRSDSQCPAPTLLIGGIVPAMATPLNHTGDNVDDLATRALVRFLVSKDIHGLFALGSTGEAVLLETRERMRVAEIVMDEVQGRLPVYIHAGGQRIEDVLKVAAHASAIGASGVAVLPPYYYSFDDEALEHFFSRIASAVSIPVYLYNIPMNAKNSISPSLFAKLCAKHDNILGVKDSSMDFATFYEFLRVRGDSTSVMMGNDSQILPALAVGGHGAVSAGATAIPEPYVKLWNAFQAGDLRKARDWQLICARIRSMFQGFPTIAPIKKVLEFREVAGSAVCEPLRGLTTAETMKLRGQYEALRSEFSF